MRSQHHQATSHYLSQCWSRSDLCHHMASLGHDKLNTVLQWKGRTFLSAFALTTDTPYRDQSRYAPSQWKMSLHCNDVFHWLGAYLDWSLPISCPHVWSIGSVLGETWPGFTALNSGITLGMGSANERRYNVMLSLIGKSHAQNDLYEWFCRASTRKLTEALFCVMIARIISLWCHFFMMLLFFFIFLQMTLHCIALPGPRVQRKGVWSLRWVDDWGYSMDKHTVKPLM